MIDHVSLGVTDLDRSKMFYDKVLEPLGFRLLVERTDSVGFGKRYPEFWLNRRAGMAPVAADTGNHVCLRAPDRSAVLTFHRRALESGGRDDGAPGDRSAAMTGYFAAFVRDPDGHRIEAATFPRSETP